MNPNLDSYQSLLTAWMQQKRSPPNPDKIEVCLNLLKIQQEKTREILNPAAILAAVQDSPLQFTDLFQRTECGKYRWQLLQNGSESGESAASPPKAAPQGSAAQIEEIYQAYPRHIGKAAALKAIRAAVKRMEERDSSEDAIAFLLERTKLFAASPAGKRGQYTAHPATWFNRESYLDDEQEWGATENRSGNLKRDLTAQEDKTPGMSDDDL